MLLQVRTETPVEVLKYPEASKDGDKITAPENPGLALRNGCFGGYIAALELQGAEAPR